MATRFTDDLAATVHERQSTFTSPAMADRWRRGASMRRASDRIPAPLILHREGLLTRSVTVRLHGLDALALIFELAEDLPAVVLALVFGGRHDVRCLHL